MKTIRYSGPSEQAYVVSPTAGRFYAAHGQEISVPDNAVLTGDWSEVASGAAGNVSALVASALVYGRVAAAGTLSGGSGFTPLKTGTGVYTLTFSQAYSSTPTVVATASTGGFSANVSSTQTVATVRTFDDLGLAADAAFTTVIAGTLS